MNRDQGAYSLSNVYRPLVHPDPSSGEPVTSSRNRNRKSATQFLRRLPTAVKTVNTLKNQTSADIVTDVMVGVRKMPVLSEDAGYLRKIRKPLIEKRRRDRMNTSIDQLKLLIADSLDEYSMMKLEKADVLDVTVSRLRQLKNQEASSNMASDVSAYSSGFKDCARETIRHLVSSGVIDPESLGRLSNHLLSVHEKKSSDVTTHHVPMTTTQHRPLNSASPPLTGIQPHFHSTPVPGYSSTSSTSGSGYDSPHSYSPSASDHHSSDGSSYLQMDVSSSGYSSCVSDDSCGSFVRPFTVDHIIQEEKPWRPW